MGGGVGPAAQRGTPCVCVGGWVLGCECESCADVSGCVVRVNVGVERCKRPNRRRRNDRPRCCCPSPVGYTRPGRGRRSSGGWCRARCSERHALCVRGVSARRVLVGAHGGLGRRVTRVDVGVNSAPACYAERFPLPVSFTRPPAPNQTPPCTPAPNQTPPCTPAPNQSTPCTPASNQTPACRYSRTHTRIT